MKIKHITLGSLIVCVVLFATATPLFARILQTVASEPNGEAIWRTQCIECHGERGQGVEGKYEHPITGPTTLDELASFVEQTMPEEDPDQCVDVAAKAVATFLLEGIISPTLTNSKPRLELMHLTTAQYRNAVADLFLPVPVESNNDVKHGLLGKYYDARNTNPEKLILERIDNSVDFNWQNWSPADGFENTDEYCIAWEGSIFVSDSGDYRFFVESPNGYELSVNDLSEPLIDNWVSTVDEPEKSASLHLLGGRWYALRLKVLKVKDPVVSVHLRWQQPHRQKNEIPLTRLRPESSAPVVLVQTPFPADDSSVGYPRGTLVSPEWDQATTEAANEVAETIQRRLPKFLNVKRETENFREKALQFCDRVARSAFRRTLTEVERRLYIDSFFESTPDIQLAVKGSLMAILKSPWFLYLGLTQDNAAQKQNTELAARLSWRILDSLPSDELVHFVSAPEFSDSNARREYLKSLLQSPLGRSKWRAFFTTWLRIDDAAGLSKDPEAYVDFNHELIDDLQESALQFVNEVVWSESSDFRNLMLADYLWLNRRLATFYAPTRLDEFSESPASFRKIKMDASERSGLLTHPLLLSQLAYYRSTSPIHRGVFVSRNILGIALKPPPVAVEPLGEDYDPNMTTRERTDFQTSPENCMSCHRVINPFGFALERLDAVGRIRESDQNKPINDRVHLVNFANVDIELSGARELAEYLVGQRKTASHFVETIFHHAVKQPVAAFGATELDRLTDFFVEHDYNIQNLIVEIAISTSIFEQSIAQDRDNAK